MKLEVTFFEIGVGATVSNEKVRFNELWLSESMKAAWTVWVELGWIDANKMKVESRDWLSMCNEPRKVEIMEGIARFNRIMRENDGDWRKDLNENFFQGCESFLEIVKLIKTHSVALEITDEVTQFRKSVTLFLATGIKRGLDVDDLGRSEVFIHMIKQSLGTTPVEYPDDLEVFFNQFPSETIVSVTNASHISNELNCDAITVEIE